MPEAPHMRPSMSTLIIAAALNLAHDYIYYLTLHIHFNDCAIHTLSHEIRSYILYSVTPALPRAQEYPRNTHSDNATRRTSRPYRWARQRARDTVSAKAGWQGDQGIRTRQQRGVYRFPFLSLFIYFLLAPAASSVCKHATQHIVSLATLR